MKKRHRGALHKKHHASSHPRSTRVYRKDSASLRASAMDTVLTPAEQAVWDKLHWHD